MDPAQRYLLFKPERLALIMERTGAGVEISGRELAARVGVSHGTIQNLLNGTTRTTSERVAQRICQVTGVDLLVLWAPTGRSVPADEPNENKTGAGA
ncbi:helix-turn-helix domain-containing protein [Streptomyces sp. NPDC016309]|uniref:helix-turn-helix domain-containing protein n=1 Tax=Streptomyces sp. NPDC016309 TaxID=3364965 RepID=UPI0036FFBE6D